MSLMNENIILNSGALTKMLVATNTSQPAGNEADLVKKIEALFPERIYRRVIDHGNNRASLILRIDGRERGQGLAFVGHIDTVAFGDIQAWEHHPLEAWEQDGILYGRGAADMKGGVAAMISTALCVIDSGRVPERDLFFCFTADEEAGGMGVQAVMGSGELKDVAEYIIAEPSQMMLGLCEKGALWLRIHAEGLLAHGSRPLVGVNAVEALMEFRHRLSLAVDTETIHPLLDTTTISTTGFHGGIMTNVIPAEAQMELDIRTLPSLKNAQVIQCAEAIAAEMEAQREHLHIRIEVLNDRIPVETAPDAPMVKRMEKVFGQLSMPCRKKGMYFYTDMSQIALYTDAPFLILGPGDDKQAHVTNEHVSVSAIEDASRVFTAYIEQYYMGGLTYEANRE